MGDLTSKTRESLMREQKYSTKLSILSANGKICEKQQEVDPRIYSLDFAAENTNINVGLLHRNVIIRVGISQNHSSQVTMKLVAQLIMKKWI